MERETSFGPWLRQQRKALDLTQWDLAERIGCSGSTIQKIEDGVRRPSRQVAELLAEVLSIPPVEREAFLRWARLGSDSAATEDPTIRAGPDPRVQTTPAAPASGEQGSRTVNLPAPLTPLIGRDRELDRLSEYASRPEVRLLTLTGAPGIGKTRLAIRLAAETSHMFEGGVFFVGLAVVTDPELVVPVIAQTLGVDQNGTDVELALAQRLRDQRTLLLLDNFEQVLDATPYILDLLGACPLLKLIVTSREALRAPGEWRFPVPPLELPHAPHHASTDPIGLGRAASVTLFTQRAKAARPDFTLTEENAEPVAAICTRLDGLPLAIELAAARIGLLTPAEVRSRLDSRLRLLKGGALHLPARQRTLRGAIDWSYDLLNPAEQTLFRRLAVFSGGFSLQGVERICAAPGDDGVPDLDILDGMASLVNKSLVVRTETETQGVWLEMLETIREYALERLEGSGEAEDLRRRHAAYYVDLVEKAAPEMFRGHQQDNWLSRLERNFTNLGAAVQWASSRGDLETVGRIAGSLWRFWYVRGHLNEARQWLNLALANREHLSRATLALAIYSMGVVVETQGDFALGYSHLREALDIFKEVGNSEGVASALTSLAVVAHDRGGFAQARAYLEESLAVQNDIGNRRGLAICLLNLGVIAASQADAEATRSFYERSLVVFRELGDSQGIGTALNNLGSTAVDEGDYVAAKEFFEEALLVRRRLGSRQGTASTLRSLADLAVETGDCETAGELAVESLALYRELGNKHGTADVLLTLGKKNLTRGDLAQARTNLEESLALYNALQSTADMACCLDAMAALLTRENPPNPDKAIHLYAAADCLRSAIGLALWPYPLACRQERIRATRILLGDDALFAAGWREGQAMSSAEIAAYALGNAQPQPLGAARAR